MKKSLKKSKKVYKKDVKDCKKQFKKGPFKKDCDKLRDCIENIANAKVQASVTDYLKQAHDQGGGS